MADIPQFKLYGEDDSTFDDRIQPRLTMRSWSTLFAEEKETIFQDLINSHWIHKSSEGVLYSVLQLNHRFKRRLPAKNIHSVTIVKSPINGRIQNLDFVMEEALKDFRHIFFNEQSEELVILMLSLFAFSEIIKMNLNTHNVHKIVKKEKTYWNTLFKNLTALRSDLTIFLINSV